MFDLSRGACTGLADATYATDDVFFPGGDDTSSRGRKPKTDYTAAAAICRVCPVRDICLQDALTEDVQWGYRAGLTPEERQALKGNTTPGKEHRNRLSDAEHMERYRLHSLGWSDQQIATAQCVNPSTIKGWRFAQKLPSNSPVSRPHTPEQNRIKWEMYRAGHVDRVIAEAAGCGPKSVRVWRAKHGLKPNGVKEQVSA